MAKTIYRICLIVCLGLAIWAGLFYYQKGLRRQEKLEELTLVQRTQEAPAKTVQETLEALWKGAA